VRSVQNGHSAQNPKTEQNYPSWSWSDEEQRWEPPIPYPDPNFYYEWDEDNQQWVLIEINNPE
jgi:hypothetical protein